MSSSPSVAYPPSPHRRPAPFHRPSSSSSSISSLSSIAPIIPYTPPRDATPSRPCLKRPHHPGYLPTSSTSYVSHSIPIPSDGHSVYRTARTTTEHAHVHFPPTPTMHTTYLTHSSRRYDRRPVVVQPNECALPPRGTRTIVRDSNENEVEDDDDDDDDDVLDGDDTSDVSTISNLSPPSITLPPVPRLVPDHGSSESEDSTACWRNEAEKKVGAGNMDDILTAVDCMNLDFLPYAPVRGKESGHRGYNGHGHGHRDSDIDWEREREKEEQREMERLRDKERAKRRKEREKGREEKGKWKMEGMREVSRVDVADSGCFGGF